MLFQTRFQPIFRWYDTLYVNVIWSRLEHSMFQVFKRRINIHTVVELQAPGFSSYLNLSENDFELKISI